MSALVNVCRFNPTLGGTTDWTYSSAVAGYQGPVAAGAVSGLRYSYRAESANLAEWEIGTGLYVVGGGNVLTRERVLANSAGTTAKINFTGPPQVVIVALAEDLATPMALRDHISGLNFSTAGSSTTFSVSVGGAADGLNIEFMTLLAAISKTTSAWAVGSAAGGLDTGTIAANTWYHAFLIKRMDTGVVDVLFSLSPTAPSMPAGYNIKRHIFPLKTNASSQWQKIWQDGDVFTWDSPVVDVAVTNPGTAAVTRTLASIPTGLRVEARLLVAVLASVAADFCASVYVSDLATPDQVPNVATFATIASFVGLSPSTVSIGAQAPVWTNTSAQVRTRLQNSAAGTTLYMQTMGFRYTRGRL